MNIKQDFLIPDTTVVYSSTPAIYSITNTVTPDPTGVYSTTLANTM